MKSWVSVLLGAMTTTWVAYLLSNMKPEPQCVFLVYLAVLISSYHSPHPKINEVMFRVLWFVVVGLGLGRIGFALASLMTGRSCSSPEPVMCWMPVLEWMMAMGWAIISTPIAWLMYRRIRQPQWERKWVYVLLGVGVMAVLVDMMM